MTGISFGPGGVDIRNLLRLQAAGALGFAGICFAVPLKASAGKRLPELLKRLAAQFGCSVEELRLDHDPPLGARKRRGTGKQTKYTPPANSPIHLSYRPHGPEHDGSHLIKTNVRGEHGQHPDRVLIKKAKRLERGLRKKPKRKWASKPFPKGRSFRKPSHETSR